MSTIAVIDTETASLNGGVCDLAFIEIDEELEILSTYESLIDPCQRIVPAAQAIHGITNEMVADQPTMAELIERDGNRFAVEDLILIGHNVQFDCRMLADVLPANYTKVCTLRMARNLWTELKKDEENHKLGTLAIMFGLESGPAHRAMGDAVTCLNLLRYITRAAKVTSFKNLIQLGTSPLSLETRINFGKHEGMRLRELPISYVQWICNQQSMDPDLRAALAVRLK